MAFDDDFTGEDADLYENRDDAYGSSAEFSDGFQIIDGDPDEFADDAAADWLRSQTESQEIQHDEDNISADPSQGMASLTGLKQGQISHYEPVVQKAIVDAIEGNLDGSRASKDKLDIDVAVQKSEADIGGDARAIISGLSLSGDKLPGKVKQVAPELYENYEQGQDVEFSREYHAAPSSETVNRALGFFEKTSDYADRGPGLQLAGHVMSIDGQTGDDAERRIAQQNQMDQDTRDATAALSELADLYIDPRTKAAPVRTEIVNGREVTVDIYGTRKKAVEQALVERFMGFNYEGARSLLPQPNETGVTGLVRTQGARTGPQGTPYTRVGFAVARDDLTEEEQLIFQPSLRRSLFPLDKTLADPMATSKHELEQAYGKAELVRRVFREQLPSHRDESAGQAYRAAFDKPYGDQTSSMNAWEEAAQLGLSMDALSVPTGAGGDITGAGGGDGTGQASMSVTGYQRPVWTAGAAGPPTSDEMTRAQETFAVQSSNFEKSLARAAQGIDGGTEEGGTGGAFSRAGMYGEKGVSEQALYTRAREAGLTKDEAFNVATKGSTEALEEGDRAAIVLRPGMSDRERYLTNQQLNPSPEQGSAEWLKAREGNITASNAAALLRKKGVAGTALKMGLEKLGYGEKFRGNADTVEGNQGEELALNAFLRGPGQGLIAEEAFFETNEKLPGMGASPDARLFDAEGNSQGLLELKYLAPDRLKGAVKRYTPQMQMQMMVTGETQTHFYALDKYTGKFVSEVIEADPDMQEQLAANAQEALELTEGLETIKDVQELRMSLRQRVDDSKLSGPKAGASSKFTPAAAKAEEVSKMTAYRPEPIKRAFTPADAEQASVAMQIYREAESTIRANDETGAEPDRRVVMDLFEATAKSKGIDTKTLEAGRRQLAVEGMAGKEAFDDEMSTAVKEAKEEEAAASRDNARAKQAERQSSEELAQSMNTASKAANIFADVAKVVLEGSKTGMDEVRLAAEIGMDVDLTRGVRNQLEMGGLTTGGATNVLSAAGQLQRQFANEQTTAAEFTRISKEFGVSNVGLSINDLPGIDAMRAMDPQQMVGMVTGLMEGKTMEQRSVIAEIFGMQELAVSTASQQDITGAVADMREPGLRNTQRSITGVEQAARGARELTASQEGQKGQVAGAAAAIQRETSKYGLTGSMPAQAVVASAAGGAYAGSVLSEFITTPIVDMFMGDYDFAEDRKITPVDLPIDGSVASDKIESNVEVNVVVDKDGVTTTVDNNDDVYLDQENTYTP